LDIQFFDGSALDAFGRLRVGQSETLFAAPATYGHNTLQWEKSSTSDGDDPLFSADTRMSLLKIVAGATGGTSYIISRAYHPYRPGKSLKISMTGVMGSATAGAVKRYGYGDDNNGIFFEQNGTSGLQFNRRTKTSGSVVNNTVAQSSWNIDKFDGTGPSGITLDVTTGFIIEIDLQYLGMGRVRIGFNVNGILYYAHEFDNANSLAVPYMQQAMLPVLAEIVAAAGLAGDATCHFKCAEVSSEGGFEDILGYANSAEGTVTAANGSRTHILSLRPKTTFNSIANRSIINFEDIQILVTDAAPILWEFVAGAAFSVAPTFADVNTTFSGYEKGTGGTFSNLTTGVVLKAGYCNGAKDVGQIIGNEIANRAPCTLDRSGAVTALGTLSVLVTGIGATSATRCSLNWKEIR
jgi:hypothetical protein